MHTVVYRYRYFNLFSFKTTMINDWFSHIKTFKLFFFLEQFKGTVWMILFKNQFIYLITCVSLWSSPTTAFIHTSDIFQSIHGKSNIIKCFTTHNTMCIENFPNILLTLRIINRYLTLSFPALIQGHWYFDNAPVISYISPHDRNLSGVSMRKNTVIMRIGDCVS